MAWDWIKMREDLHEDPAVLSIARNLQTRPEHVVGYCHKFWSWVSRNCPDGVLKGLVLDDIGSVLALPGFPQLLVSVGWLEYDDSGQSPVIRIPKFDRHLSQGAKSRALTAERKRIERGRNLSGFCPESAGQNMRPEKRREEKSINAERSASQHVNFAPDEISGEASNLFRKLGYSGSDGAILWRVACLLGAGVLSEDQVHDAIAGTVECAKGNPLGYFRKCLERHCGGRDVLNAHLRRVRIPKTFCAGPPKNGRLDESRSLADSLSNKD